ncbi:MAG: hypothetical protein D6683_00615 [Actinomyces sp.]|nr:MAG: hypothetical protein D6683_00615 [Actinomyces sp.]
MSGATTAPTPGERLRNHAGLLAASAAAMVWAILASRHPTNTYHFSPLVVAGLWGWAERWATRRRHRGRAALLRGAAGAAVSLVTLAELAVSDALRGPTLWHAHGTAPVVAEALAFTVLGAAFGARQAARPESVAERTLEVDGR